MSEHHIDDKPFPTTALYAAAGLIVLAIVSAATARLTDVGATRLTLAAPVSSVQLRFVDLDDGSIGAIDADSGRTVQRYAPGESGFVRTIMRSFAFNRSRSGVGSEPPFTLSERADGSIVIEDPATQRIVPLDAFGHANIIAFQDLLRKGKAVP